jgi:acetyl-CoA carboxylase carboxyl transferase subunit beta
MVSPENEPVSARMHCLPANLMTKCASCGAMLVTKDWLRDLKVCPRCGHHGRMGAHERIALLTENFAEWDSELTARDPLQFPDYAPKRLSSQQKTGLKDSMVTGGATLVGRPIAIAASDFGFMGGSMNAVFGEKITRMMERALVERRPVITCTSTGGARMQEGLMSLMQMAKTSAAVARLKENNIPFISVLTDPSMAGVQASFASLGDLHIAEPGAMIGFTGGRVIEQNLRIKLPRDFQSAEFQMAHGQIDLIVHRSKLKEQLAQILSLLLD